ncbi:cell adhesion molecule 3-like [Pholidichthys leucotaenia]
MSLFLIFSCLILCAGKSMGACPIEMGPSKVVVSYGGSFSANCSSLTHDTIGMGWESQHGGVELTLGVTTLPFKIDKVNDFIISPSCYIYRQDDSQCIEKLPVTVYQLPTRVYLHEPSSLTMLEGQQYGLKCEIFDVAPAKNLSVLWYKGNKKINTASSSESSLKPVKVLSEMSFTASREDDSAQIWCEAQLNLWSAEQKLPSNKSNSYKLTVLSAPAFTMPENETVTLQALKNLTLNCTATGNPSPKYRWQLPHASQEMDEDLTQSILSPSFVLPGHYACTASNSQGSSTKYFNVIKDPGNQATLAAIIGVFAALGAVLFIIGVLLVKSDGTFSCNKGSYQPASSRPV